MNQPHQFTREEQAFQSILTQIEASHLAGIETQRTQTSVLALGQDRDAST
jgi:hypothetical protein